MRSGSNSIMKGLVFVSLAIMAATLSSAATPAADDNPSGLPICWARLDNCVTAQSEGGSTDFPPMCCPVLKTQISDAKCFCNIKSFVDSIPTNQPSAVTSSKIDLIVNTMLATCKIEGSFQGICKGVKSGSASKIAAMNLLPVAALISATALFM